MDSMTVIRAWKDSDYREGLSDAERALLPAHPAGFIELTDSELSHVAGGGGHPRNCGCKPCKKRRRRRKNTSRSRSNSGSS